MSLEQALTMYKALAEADRSPILERTHPGAYRITLEFGEATDGQLTTAFEQIKATHPEARIIASDGLIAVS